MCSLSQQILDSPARPKTLLRGEMELLAEAIPTGDSSPTFSKDEMRDDELLGGSGGSSSGSSTSSSRQSLSSLVEAASCPVSSIPFAKTFAVSESYNKKTPQRMNSTMATSQLHDDTRRHPHHPMRRRARSSEGMTVRKLHSERHNYSASFDQNEKTQQEICWLEASLKSPRHLFSPMGGSNKNTAKNNQIRQRKHIIGKNNRAPKSEPGTATATISQHRRISPKANNKYNKQRGKSSYVIPIEHPFKVIWDVLTVVLSVAHGYLTHVAIRDRQFGMSPFIAFCDCWFFVDILLNFVTERKTSAGDVFSDHRSIIARYLTSWFAVDALSLFPWECLYMKPLVELQNRRGILKKSFFRSKAVVRVTRHLRGKHVRWFGTVARRTKQHGLGGQRLLRLLIKYLPKYFMFLRNMKAIVAIRIFRYIHWGRRFFRNMQPQTENVDGSTKSTHSDASTESLTTRGAEDNSCHGLSDDDNDELQKISVEVVYDDWKMHFDDDDDDDDDGVPL